MGVYANALGNGFAFDDVTFIVNNADVHDLGSVPRLFTERHWDVYRPITLSTYALEWAVAGGAPMLHHATSVVLHAAVTCLVFLLLVRLGAGPTGAGVGAALFAVHPVHVEAVANIAGRAELLVALFGLLAILVYLSDRSRTHRTIGVAVFLALALGSKENGVVVPALMLLTTAFLSPTLRDAWTRVRRDLPVFAGVAVVGLTWGVVRTSIVGTVGMIQRPYGMVLDTSERILTALSVFPEYVRLLLFPADLSVEYGPAVLMPARSVTLEVVLGAIVGVGCLALIPALWRRSRWVSLAVAWFALAIFPVSNLVIPVGVWLAERTLYLPSVAVAMLVAPLVGAVLGEGRSPLPNAPAVAPAGLAPTRVAGVLVLLIALGSWRTWTRTPIWASTETVLQSLLEEHPESFRAQWYMGTVLSLRGDVARGLDYLERAMALTPRHGEVVMEYARLLGANGRPAEAEQVLRENDWLSRRADWSAYLTLSLLEQGRVDEALDVAQQGVRRNPDDDQALAALEAARAAAEPPPEAATFPPPAPPPSV
jgi:hypothetical protein